MPVTSEASTTWTGSLTDGSGSVSLASSTLGTFPIDWKTRSAGGGTATTPEELMAAAHASCFSMALAHALTENGTPPERVNATASITFKPGVGITGSHLNVNAVVPGVSPEAFRQIAEGAKSGCPVPQALSGIDITLEATLA